MMACRAEISAKYHCHNATAKDVCAVHLGGGGYYLTGRSVFEPPYMWLRNCTVLWMHGQTHALVCVGDTAALSCMRTLFVVVAA